MTIDINNKSSEQEKITKSNQLIIQNLEKIFGANIIQGIKEKIDFTNLDGIKKINEILGQSFINSCFHPDEYGIGAYRTTSLVNTAELAKNLGLKIDLFYLDTISSGGIKGVFNPQLSKKFNKKTLFKTISDISLEEKELKDKMQQINEIFSSFLEATSFDDINNKKTIKYIENILDKLELKEDFFNFIEEKEKEYIEKIKSSGGIIKNEKLFIQKSKEQFLAFILGQKIKARLVEIKDLFKKNTLGNKKYSNGISTVEIYGELQNAILTILVDENFGEYKNLLDEVGIVKNNKISIENSYNNNDFIAIQQKSINEIISDDNLGKDLFLKYFDKLSDRADGKPVEILNFGENKNNILIIYKENGKIDFYLKKGKDKPEKIEENKAFDILIGEEKVDKYNLAGNIMLFLSGLSGQFHIGSERGYRELTAQTLEEFLQEKGNLTEANKEYIKKIILGLGIFDTFDEGDNNEGKKLAGSVGTALDDMMELLFIGGDFSIDQIQKAIIDNSNIPKIDKEKLLDSFKTEILKVKGKILSLNDNDSIKQNYLEEFDKLLNKYNEEKTLKNFLNLSYYAYTINKNKKLK